MTTPTLRKAGWLRWEADVTFGNSVYTFVGYRKKALVRRAETFIAYLKEQRQ